jgi:hypothetical protein
MVPGCVPFKIVSDSPTIHSRWLLFFKVMIISLWNLLQYHSIVRWAKQAQWAEPLVKKTSLIQWLLYNSKSGRSISATCMFRRITSLYTKKHTHTKMGGGGKFTKVMQSSRWAPVIWPKTSETVCTSVFFSFFKPYIKINSRIWLGPVNSNFRFEYWSCNICL